MLKLADFFHLPEIDAMFAQLVAAGPGLIVVAGLDPRPVTGSAPGGFLPSGRSTLFRIAMREIMEAEPDAQAIVVTEDRASIRIPRQMKHRVKVLAAEPPYSYAGQIASAVAQKPDLLVIDRLDAATLPRALEAGRSGRRVLSQIETVFRGTDVIHHLSELGATPEQLDGLAWILSVQRMTTLCPQCKTACAPLPAQIERLRQKYPHLAALLPQTGDETPWRRADGCTRCDGTGRHGDVMAFDVFRADADTPRIVGQLSALPMEEYVLRLALGGHLSLEDVMLFETDTFRRTYHMLVASETALSDTNARLERKLVEIGAANRVLEQRTQALNSLGDIGQALISSADLDDLAARVCHYACELCGADHAILYYLHRADQAEVLAVSGWDTALIHQQLEIDLAAVKLAGLSPFHQRPPGIPPSAPEVQFTQLRAGLYVPLLAQGDRVGFMIVHSTRKTRFEPGQTALLQTFAHQAAVAIQRAGLIDQLRAKIVQLEAAQVELAKKERIERELELARQVQQSVLPRTFPEIGGYRFAAGNEPARQVGGDFYDVILLDDHHFGVAIADVSDKGMPAALYMALTRSLLRTEARRERSPRTVLETVNQLLLELGEPNMFVSVFYGVVDRATRELTYCRAGHDRPILARAGTTQNLGGRGVALGIFDRDRFRLTEEQIALAPGDRLLLYTDGLTDMQTTAGDFFGQERLKTLFQARTDRTPAQVCEDLFAALHTFQGEADQYDDMTMLVITVD